MNVDELGLQNQYAPDADPGPSLASPSSSKELINGKRCCASHVAGDCQCVLTQRYSNAGTCPRGIIAEPVLQQALKIFLADTVMPAPSGSANKGHFANLCALMHSSPRSDPFPFALEAVALASVAHRFGRPNLQLEATRRYTTSINLLRKTNFNGDINISSVIACILLLGVYEIIMANTSADLKWVHHLQGLIAVLKGSLDRKQVLPSGIPMLVVGTEPPLNFGNESVNKDLHVHSSTPVAQPAGSQFSELCTILPKVQNLFKDSVAVLAPQSIRYEAALRRLRDRAIALKAALLAWNSAQPQQCRPRTIERFTQPYMLRFPGVDDLICPVTRADVYDDYFIASMWNSYRQCQLHLTDLLSRINRCLSTRPETYTSSRDFLKLRNEAISFADDTIASIPFMLAGERINGNKPRASTWAQIRPPMLIGGLNMQWILFTISILEIIPNDVRQKMKTILLWIGKNLGIRQATILAHMDKNIPGGITARGDALRWAGFLI